MKGIGYGSFTQRRSWVNERMAVDVAQLETPLTTEPTARAMEERRDGSWAPLLEPTSGGTAERFATAISPGHPIRVFLAAILSGYAVLLGLTIALGFLLTRVILKIDGVAAWDERVSRALVRERTGTTVDLSWVGSTLAGELAADARAAGVTELVATVCGDNPRILALLERLGSLSQTWRGGERELVVGLEH